MFFRYTKNIPNSHAITLNWIFWKNCTQKAVKRVRNQLCIVLKKPFAKGSFYLKYKHFFSFCTFLAGIIYFLCTNSNFTLRFLFNLMQSLALSSAQLKFFFILSPVVRITKHTVTIFPES